MQPATITQARILPKEKLHRTRTPPCCPILRQLWLKEKTEGNLPKLLKQKKGAYRWLPVRQAVMRKADIGVALEEKKNLHFFLQSFITSRKGRIKDVKSKKGGKFLKSMQHLGS